MRKVDPSGDFGFRRFNWTDPCSARSDMFVEFELSMDPAPLGAEYGIAPLERKLSLLAFYKHVAPSGAWNGPIVQ